MTGHELERVKKDVEVIRESMGLDLPFGWEDVWLNVCLVPLGVWLATWSLLPYQLSRLWRILPAAILALILVLLRVKYRRSTGRSPVRRRLYSIGLLACPILGLCAFGYLVWVVRSGHDFVFAVGGVWFIAGLMLLVFALAQPGWLSGLGWAIPMILCGITITVWPVLNVLETNVGVVLIVAGSATAVIQAYQLRSSTSKT